MPVLGRHRLAVTAEETVRGIVRDAREVRGIFGVELVRLSRHRHEFAREFLDASV